MKRLKVRIHALLEGGRHGITGGVVGRCLAALIVLNVLFLVVQSVEPVYLRYAAWFDAFEYVVLSVFTVEYLLRLFSATEDPRYRHPLAGRLRYALSPLALVDLLAVLPFWLMLVAPDLQNAGILAVLRLFRLMKIVRYSRTIRTMVHIFVSRRDELGVSLIFMLGVLVLASTLMYYVENPAQPDLFSSIPATMWWGITTLTTVGYGDMFPVTPLGRLLASVLAVLGVAMFALPAGIIGSAFVEIMQARQRRRADCCPHCGAVRPAGDGNGGSSAPQ